MLTVLRLSVKVRRVELGGTDFLLPILRLAIWINKDPKLINFEHITLLKRGSSLIRARDPPCFTRCQL